MARYSSANCAIFTGIANMSDFADFWYRSPDGLRLYARDYPCRDETLDEPEVVLCMPGLTRNSADFDRLARYLSASRRVIAVDKRGRGRSDYDSRIENYNPGVYAQDMFTLLDELGVERVILAGTSVGGLMAFLMAGMQPRRIRGMVLNDIGPEVDPRGIERLKAYVGKSPPVTNWDEAVAQARDINGLAFPDFSDAEWLDFTRGIYREESGVPVLAYDPAIAQPIAENESAAVPPDLWSLFEAVVPVPMLLIRGAHSDILAPDCVARMRELKPDLQVVEILNRGHAPTLNEADARAAIDGFLARL